MTRKAIPAFLFLGLLCANYIAGRYGGFPFAYCWGNALLSEWYMAFGQLVLYALSVVVVVSALAGSLRILMLGCAVFFCVVHAPDVAAMIFKMGGTCG